MINLVMQVYIGKGIKISTTTEKSKTFKLFYAIQNKIQNTESQRISKREIIP